MIKPEQIPDEVVEAYLLARSEGAFTPNELIATAINAWPYNYRITLDYTNGPTPMLVLPLPKEPEA